MYIQGDRQKVSPYRNINSSYRIKTFQLEFIGSSDRGIKEAL